MDTLSGLASDLRFAVRALFQHPGFTLVAVLTLALGIGANAVIFSVAHAVLLRPLPYRDSGRLVLLLSDNPEIGVDGAGLAFGDYLEVRRASRTITGLAAQTPKTFDLTGGPVPEVIPGLQVSPGFFAVLGASAARGRTFLPEEESPARSQVAILSDGFWRRCFGASAAAVGKTLELDGDSYQVVGVMPPGFRFGRAESDVWVPLPVPAEEADRRSHYLGTVGRLAPGATESQVAAELKALSQAMMQAHPDSNRGWSLRARSLAEHVTRQVRPALVVLSGAVGLLLLIACTNVANLLLARGASRQNETAIRATLGAQRSRLVRLLLVESTLLSLVGAAVGLLLALWGVQALIATGPADFPRLSEIGVDRTVLVFATLLALVCGLAFGSVPALQLSRIDLHRLTKEGQGTGAKSSARLRSSLVVSEVALALVLLIGAALMVQGFVRLSRVEPGFDPKDTLVAQIFLSPNRYAAVPPQVQFFERLLDETRRLPGVVAAAASSGVPLVPLGQNLLPFEAEGSDKAKDAAGNFAVFSSVTPGWFQTLQIPLRQGRDFSPRDDAGAPPVLIVDEALARRFWPNENAVGKYLRATIQSAEPVRYEIVGVVGSIRARDLTSDPEPAIYAPYRQVPPRGMAVFLRGQGEPARLANLLRSRMLTLDPDQPIFRTTTLEQVVSDAGARTKFYTAVLALFAVAGLALAAIGIYGVLAYTVSLRSREMALRVALGAHRGHIFGLVIGDGLRLALTGVALGLVGAVALSRLLSSLLFGIGARDPLTLTMVPILLLLVAILASYVPARRAVRADPMLPMRQG